MSVRRNLLRPFGSWRADTVAELSSINPVHGEEIYVVEREAWFKYNDYSQNWDAMSLVHTAAMTLTHDQIKTLPTVPVDVVAALGSGLVIVVTRFVQRIDATAEAYTNVNVAAQFNYSYGNTGKPPINIPDGDPILASRLEDDQGIAFDIFNGWSALGSSWEYLSDFDNQPFRFDASNASDGNFTGGHASNTITLLVAYHTFNLTTGKLI